MRESSRELIFTQYPPMGPMAVDFVACTEGPGAGIPTEGTLCRDAATD
jgi:hypothetical protein